MINSDFQIFGVVCLILCGIFYTSSIDNRFWRCIYRCIPVMVACYLLPSFLNSFGLINYQSSNLSYLATDYLMPSCLCLMLLELDLNAILKNGGKLLILVIIGGIGVFIGGPITFLCIKVIQPELLLAEGSESVWRGMTTLAGNWVGGTANQLAMKVLYDVGDNIFGIFVAVNVIISGLWMACLLALAPYENRINTYLKSKEPPPPTYTSKKPEPVIPQLQHWIALICLPLAINGIGHVIADWCSHTIGEISPLASQLQLDSSFIWLVISVTTLSIGLSFTPVKKLAAYGSGKMASVCLYIMLAIMGLKMDVITLLSLPWFFVIGLIWLSVHIITLAIATKLMRLPFGYFAIASQCNLGGAASSPIVTSAYRRELVPLSVIITVFGYVWANIVAWLCGQWLMRL